MASNETDLTLVMKAKNLASREVDRLHASLSKVKGGASNAASGLASLAKTGALLAGGALLAVGAGLLAAGKAAADEQVGIARLDAALKANIKGFKGNTDAIEAVISKREALGFSDDSLRASLTTLVTKFHDVDKAQRIQAVAMDLARAKGISLEQATSMLSKGLDGSKRVLHELGIEVGKNATQHEILAAVQKKVAGQAQAYGKTAAGAQEAFGVAVQDLVEDIGAGLVPVMTQAFTWLRTNAIPAIRRVIAAVSNWMAQNRPLINQIKNFAQTVLKNVATAIGRVIDWIGKFIASITSNKDVMNFLNQAFSNLVGFIQNVWGALATLIGFLSKVWDNLSHNQTVINATKTAFKILGDAIGTVVSAFKWLLDNGAKVVGFLSNLKLPDLSGLPHFAGGVTGFGGGLALVGERGPELVQLPRGSNVIPNDRLPRGSGSMAASGYELVAVSSKDLAKAMDRQTYFLLRRSGTGH